MAAKKTKTTKSSKVTMDDLLKKYDASVNNLNQGDEVEGEIISISDSRVAVDIGGKCEGIVAEKAFKEAREYIKTLKVGQKIKANVIVPETYDGFTILTLRHSVQKEAWEKIEKAAKDKTPLSVTGKNTNSAGVVVDVLGMSGFVPASQLGRELAPKANTLVNKSFKAIPIEVDQKGNKIVLSERLVSDADLIEKEEKALKKIKVDEVYKGEVTGVTNFGCFVSVPVKVGKEDISIEGLVHLSELAWDKVGRAEDVVSVGDEVEVKVLGVEDNKLSLSMKDASDDPWESVAKEYKKDSKHEGTVTKISDYGMFVSLAEGVEGLVHNTKLPPGKKYAEGDKVKVYVEEVDAKERKISLGIVLTSKPVAYR